MDIILVPGFWLDGDSWAPVLGPLEAAGHRVHPLTLPGKESADADRSGIGLRDHVDAVVARIDELDGPVVLVGHSGGGAIIHAATDARPDRVARSVYVDSGPLGEGGVINDEIPTDGPDAPLPPWEFFEDADLTDLTDELRAAFRARAVPEPARVTSDPQHLHDERRFDVPVTVIACEFTGDQMRAWIAAGNPFVAELAHIRDVDLVDLPTGHWPQLTRPDDLAEALVAAVAR
ncbi:alpha/beta fold hydrolase [Tersicoccus sp. Bi-70]|uniref:alpha/beta fold hydrolase n=1 Tax=Tersicoccus sp. Bi-70 TaxID=1897634 RepID=UPI000975B921|nr:alpha/beta fold hydrolase [Tersicoccus sp. Bi-70]OMH31245.1 esterase [Tersicoccus sp. Bi-70]